MSTEPGLEVLAHRRFIEAYEEARRRRGWQRPWYERWLGVRPRGFYDRGRDVVVVDRDHCEPAAARWGRRLGLRLGRVGLLAHEWGHAVGVGHPPVWSVAYWTDVSGMGLRCADRHRLVARSRGWRRAVWEVEKG